MNFIHNIVLFIFFYESFSNSIFLKRKYPHVENGVYQINRKGHPIKIVDVNYGHVWTIPKKEKEGQKKTEEEEAYEKEFDTNYAVVQKNGKVYEFSKGTNIKYGTTKKLEMEKKEPKSAADIKKEINKNKKKGVIKNLVNVNKKKEQKDLAKAMYIEAEEVKEEEEKKEQTETEKELDEGKYLGELIKENMEDHYEESDEPSDLSTDVINRKMPKSIEDLLKEDLNEEKWLIQKPIKDQICLRDYTKQCPSTWEKISETQCRAPKDYNGHCAHILTFEPLTAKEKSKLGMECGLNWSCLNESCGNSERDYSYDCPLEWKYTGKCEAPKNYNGGCDRVMDFGAYTQSEKEEFSSTCKAVWPCKEQSCERDYTITCPQGWGYDISKDLCISPKKYEELLSSNDIESITHMSFNEKLAFSNKYGISWPCKKECTYGYDEYVCPRNWKNIMNSGICKAPDSYVPPFNCPTLTHFDYMTSEEKKEFSKKCNVKWNCLENANRDYSVCPINFDYINEGKDVGKCKPNQFYKGPCKLTQNILNLSLEDKIKFEETCEAPFPIAEVEKIQKIQEETLTKEKLEKLLKGSHLHDGGITLE